MCGASKEQKDMYSKQSAFYDLMTKQYQTVFGQQQAILGELTDVFKPILEAGPDQEGFGGEEKAALQTVTNENIASNYNAASEALEESIAGRQGSAVIPSGADEAQRRNLAARAAATKSGIENSNTLANFQAGRTKWQMATDEMNTVAAQLNPIGFSGATTAAGHEAAGTATDIAKASNSIWSSVIGAIGGVASSAITQGFGGGNKPGAGGGGGQPSGGGSSG